MTVTKIHTHTTLHFTQFLVSLAKTKSVLYTVLTTYEESNNKISAYKWIPESLMYK